MGGKQIGGWELVGKMLRYVWPKGNWHLKRRVLVAMALLVGAKVW